MSKLSDFIDNLRTNLQWLGEKNTGMNKWARDNEYTFSDLTKELRLLRGICCCVEKFLLQDLASESEENEVDQTLESEENELDQTLESFFKDIRNDIYLKASEIYQEMNKAYELELELEDDDTRCDALFSSFLEAVEILKPLCRKVSEHMHSSESNHCTMEELVEFIQLVSQDGMEIHSGSNFESLQLPKLDFLKSFITFATSRGVGQDKLQDLLAHTRDLVITAALYSSVLWRSEFKNGQTKLLIYTQYSEMLKVLPVIIVKASRSSYSSDFTKIDDDDDLLESFINSSKEYHLEPLYFHYIFEQQQIFSKELRALRNFLEDQRQEGQDPDEEIPNLFCNVANEEGMLLNSLSLDYLKELKERGLSNWMEKAQFLKQEITTETSGNKFSGTNFPKLFDWIRGWVSYLQLLRDFFRGTDRRDDAFHRIEIALRLALSICSCLDMFSLQDLTSEIDRLLVGINEKAREIYSATREIRNGKLDEIREMVPKFHYVVKMLERFLFEKAVDKYMHSSQSKHCTVEELSDLIQLVLEDGKEIHSVESMPPQKLEFLKNFILFAASRGVEQDKLQDVLAHAKVVVTTAAYCSYVLWKSEVADETTQSAIHSQYSEMLKVQESYIRLLKALGSCSSDYTKMDDNILLAFIDSLLALLENLWDLLASKSSFTVSSTKILMEELRYLRNFVVHKRHECGDLDEEMANHIFDLIGETGILSYSLSYDDEKEVPTRDTKHELLNWIQKVRLFKEDVARKYPEALRYKFPSTNELGFMDGLLEDLKELIRDNPDSIAFAQRQLDVLEDLVVLRDFLRDVVKQRNEHKELKALWFHVVDVAYRLEFVISSLVVGDRSPDCNLTSFNTIKEEIKKIRAEVKEIYVGKRFEIESLNPPNVSNRLPSRSSNPTMDEVVVGFEDEAEKIIDRLVANSAELDIVTIVGMPGQGKTTLAKKVYNDIRSHFHVCAWCCVSQGYQKRKLLLDLLSDSLHELPTGVDEMIDEDLEKELYKSLKGRRYLIVLDDIWDIEAWRGLQSLFPNDGKHSRILITSRIHSVGLQIKPDSEPHFLRQLNADESRELLQKKLFPNEGYPAELWYVERIIAESCKGLPLAIVTVAGILATLERDSWEDFANGLSTALVSRTDECTELLELSYTHLPDYLKPCLLYFGSFLQDEEIPVSRLIWLWMAEGFVRKTTEEERLENVADDYLKDLINRSLVMVVKQTSRGGIKVCSVHDLVHQFCLTRAEEENFSQQLNYGKRPLSEPRRLCTDYPKGVQCFRHVSSLKLFPQSYGVEVSSFLCSFKILKVLDLRGISCDHFPAEVEMLVHLRFLALVGKITSIPSTIVKLWHLETFLLRGLRGGISLPYTLLNITKLRHMHVNTSVVFSLPKQNIEKCCESCNLETLSNPVLSPGQDMVKIIRKMPYLRKLKCTFFASRDSKEAYQFPALNFLSQLESLNVRSTYKVRYQLKLNFPLTLKKLTLSNFYLPWASISRIAELPNLEVLKLVNRACEGETWDMEEEVFRKLQFLKFENLDIVHWNACSDNFPCLRQLVLHKCGKLQEIPSGIGEVDSLKIVEVKHCQSSVATSAQNLEKEVEGLKVFIYAAPM